MLGSNVVALNKRHGRLLSLEMGNTKGELNDHPHKYPQISVLKHFPNKEHGSRSQAERWSR